MRSKEAIQLRIKQICNENHMTINALARSSGITQSTLNNIMSGRNNSVTVSTILKICDGVNMNLPQFFNSEVFENLEQEIY